MRIRGELPGGFYISIDRLSKVKRLHSLKCYRTPSVDFSPWAYLGDKEPDEHAYDCVCRPCFRLHAGEALRATPGGDLASDEEFTSDESEAEAMDPIFSTGP